MMERGDLLMIIVFVLAHVINGKCGYILNI